MPHSLLTHLMAPGHTHRSLDPGVVDRQLARLRDAPAPQDLPHLRGLESLSRISHALEPLTHRGDAVFGTLRRRGEPSDFGMCAPLYQICAKAGRASRPMVLRAFLPLASAFCSNLPPCMLGALHPDVQHAKAAAATLLSAAVAALPGQLFGMSVMPICWSTSQTWAATKLAILGSSYLAGFAMGQIEQKTHQLVGPKAAMMPQPKPCNDVSFLAHTPIDDILPALRFVTQDGRHVFDVEELGQWFRTSHSRRNVYTNEPFGAVDDARLAGYDIDGLDDPLYRGVHSRWAHFAPADILMLMQCAAALVIAPNGSYVEAATGQIQALLQRYTPAECAALDTLFSRIDGTPLAEHLAACQGTERARRAAGAQLYAALSAPMFLLMWRLVPAAVRGVPSAAQLLANLLSQDINVHACLQIIASAPLQAVDELLPVDEVAAIWPKDAVYTHPAIQMG